MTQKPKPPRARTKWTKAGKLRGRPPGSRSYDPETSRSADPPIRKPERRGRHAVAFKEMILRLIQQEIGRNKPRFARELAEATRKDGVEGEKRGIKEETVKRRLRRDRSDAQKRRTLRKYSRWFFD